MNVNLVNPSPILILMSTCIIKLPAIPVGLNLVFLRATLLWLKHTKRSEREHMVETICCLDLGVGVQYECGSRGRPFII